MTLVSSSIIFLAATVVAVPLFKKLKLGAILGYLVAGVLIGPSVMNWIGQPEHILHFAEIGVVLMLFVIGLELEPNKLWRMRNQILLSGGGQLLLSALIVGVLVLVLLSYEMNVALVIGLGVALSSTAFAIQLMKEQGMLQSPPGQGGFSMLLMQDLAVIPILLLVAHLSPTEHSNAPPWWIGVLTILGVLAIGRYLINPFLRIVSKYGSGEVMTAAALLIVLATASGFQAAGFSMGMGAFVAGMLLANSSFKHQLEAEIEPFQGLLLGLFFIAIGMNLDLNLLISEPVFIVGCAILLIVIKTAVIFFILKLNKQSNTDSMRIALMLSQGGEFAFVVMTQAVSSHLIDPLVASKVSLIVGISMALTSPLVILHSLFFVSKHSQPVYDTSADSDEPQVIIAGFGRFGQIAGRILTANKIHFTALDKDADHIEFVKGFGNKTFFGDATRLDLLRTAGIEHAKVLFIAVDNSEDGLSIAKLAKEHYPHIKIVARTSDRRTYRQYHEIGVQHCVRELFDGSLQAARMVLTEFGYSHTEADRMAHIFEVHDIQRLENTLHLGNDQKGLLESAKKGRLELESLFEADRQVN